MGFLAFVQGNPRAKSVMPSAKLGWDRLFAEIRSLASAGTVSVYDAACGFGGIANELVNDTTCHNLRYLGVDIHAQLETILQRIPQLSVCGLLMQHDISSPPPIDERFDYVLCRASLHHTPHPPQSFAALCSMLKPGGKIAVSLYRKKGPCREAIDDALRAVVSGMSSDEAFDVCRQFTEFGKALQAVQEKVSVPQDLPLLGINKGEYGVHELFYWYFLKCFYNNEFGDKYSTLVNFDWYHPPFAYRYTREEVESWFEQNRIRVIETQSIDAQHYLFGEKHPEQSGRSC
jgi:SAM-dependent methyltransferase